MPTKKEIEELEAFPSNVKLAFCNYIIANKICGWETCCFTRWRNSTPASDDWCQCWMEIDPLKRMMLKIKYGEQENGFD
jgi:hypothetical protein